MAIPLSVVELDGIFFGLGLCHVLVDVHRDRRLRLDDSTATLLGRFCPPCAGRLTPWHLVLVGFVRLALDDCRLVTLVLDGFVRLVLDGCRLVLLVLDGFVRLVLDDCRLVLLVPDGFVRLGWTIATLCTLCWTVLSALRWTVAALFTLCRTVGYFAGRSCSSLQTCRVGALCLSHRLACFRCLLG